MARTGIYKAPWKSILNNILGEGKWEIQSVEFSSLVDALEEDFDVYLTNKRQETAAAGVEKMLSDAEAKIIAGKLHNTFKMSGSNEWNLDALTAFYSRDHAVDFALAKADIKALVKKQTGIWDMNRGPAPTVRRLLSPKGAATGQQSFPVAAAGDVPPNKTFQRHTKSVRDTGITKQQFEALQHKLGRKEVTIPEIVNFINPPVKSTTAPSVEDIARMTKKKPDMNKLPTVAKSEPVVELDDEEDEEEETAADDDE